MVFSLKNVTFAVFSNVQNCSYNLLVLSVIPSISKTYFFSALCFAKILLSFNVSVVTALATSPCRRSCTSQVLGWETCLFSFLNAALCFLASYRQDVLILFELIYRMWTRSSWSLFISLPLHTQCLRFTGWCFLLRMRYSLAGFFQRTCLGGYNTRFSFDFEHEEQFSGPWFACTVRCASVNSRKFDKKGSDPNLLVTEIKLTRCNSSNQFRHEQRRWNCVVLDVRHGFYSFVYCLFVSIWLGNYSHVPKVCMYFYWGLEVQWGARLFEWVLQGIRFNVLPTSAEAAFESIPLCSQQYSVESLLIVKGVTNQSFCLKLLSKVGCRWQILIETANQGVQFCAIIICSV